MAGKEPKKKSVMAENFRTNVNSILEVKDIQRVELAERLKIVLGNCTKSYVTQVLNARHTPSLGVVEDFAKALRIKEPTDLLIKHGIRYWRDRLS